MLTAICQNGFSVLCFIDPFPFWNKRQKCPLASAERLRLGTVQGAGRQSRGVLINVVAYFVCGLPVATLLAFKLGFDVDGLVLGMILGTAIQAVWYTSMVLGFDWEAESRAALGRVAKNAGLVPEAILEQGDQQVADDILSQGNKSSVASEAVCIARRFSRPSLDLPRASFG